MDQPTYGIVGRGRVASHLSRYLELESLAHCSWHRGMKARPEDTLGSATVILLAISDDAIVPFTEQHPALLRHRVIHFSGCRVFDGIPGLHPLMTFGPELYPLENYRAIPFVSELGQTAFREIFPSLQNPSLSIDPQLKPLYHAFCVMAGNFPMMLWAKTLGEFEERLGLPRRLLKPYLSRVLENTLDSDRSALTGPLARGDRKTVRDNLDALGDDPYAGIYRAFAHSHGMTEL